MQYYWQQELAHDIQIKPKTKHWRTTFMYVQPQSWQNLATILVNDHDQHILSYVDHDKP